jgi:hypothetical protein
MDPEILETVDAVIDALGGNSGIAALTGSKPSALSMWRSAEGFPSNTYVIITDALRTKGKAAPTSLWPGMRVPTDQQVVPSASEQGILA